MLVALEYLNQQWEEPGLTELYLMQVAAEVRRVLAKKPGEIKLDHFKLKFDRKQRTPKNADEIAKTAKSAWFGVLGIPQEKPDG